MCAASVLIECIFHFIYGYRTFWLYCGAHVLQSVSFLIIPLFISSNFTIVILFITVFMYDYSGGGGGGGASAAGASSTGGVSPTETGKKQL